MMVQVLSLQPRRAVATAFRKYAIGILLMGSLLATTCWEVSPGRTLGQESEAEPSARTVNENHQQMALHRQLTLTAGQTRVGPDHHPTSDTTRRGRTEPAASFKRSSGDLNPAVARHTASR